MKRTATTLTFLGVLVLAAGCVPPPTTELQPVLEVGCYEGTTALFFDIPDLYYAGPIDTADNGTFSLPPESQCQGLADSWPATIVYGPTAAEGDTACAALGLSRSSNPVNPNGDISDIYGNSLEGHHSCI